MKSHSPQRIAGFSIVETLMGASAAMVIGVAVFNILNTGMMLSARNLAVNATNNSMRGALDRTEQLLQMGDTLPTLIDTSGANTTGPAAGIRFDRFIGAPYVLSVPVTGMPASTTSLSLQRSTDPLASPPVPAVGDIVLLDGEAATLRPRVSAVGVGTIDTALQRQTMTASLAASLGSVVTSSSTTMTAKLVRQVALIVMPNGAKRELRYYPSWDLTTNLNDATKFTVLTDHMALQASDATPFSFITNQTKTFVNVSFRVRSNQFDRRLMGKQSDQFNTFARIDVQIRPKVNP